MDLVIKESHYRKILLESVKNGIEGSSESNKNLIKNAISNVKRSFGIDLKFILTYSVTIGGLMGPVQEIIKSEIPTLSETDLSLLIVGTIMTYYYNNVEELQRILRLIRDNNLINEFNYMLEKTGRLKDAFFDFVSSLNVNLGSMSNILAFTFLINVLSTLLKFAQNDFTNLEIEKLIMGLSGYFGALASKEITQEIIKKMILRFKGKK
jgi:hypothetical protein